MFLFNFCSVFFLQTKLPVLENHLSIGIRSLINTLNSGASCTRKVSGCVNCSWRLSCCLDSITPVWWPYVTHLLSSQRVQSTSVPSSHLSYKPARWDTLLLSGMVMLFCTESVSRQQFCRGLFIIWNINSSGEGELCISCKLKSCKRVSLQSPMPSSQQHPVISGHRQRQR